MRLKAKVDANHGEIVRAFRAAGFRVLDLSRVGKGCPDLLISHAKVPNYNGLIEIKDGSKSASQRQLTEAQKEFHHTWHGPIHIIETIGEVAELLTEVFKGGLIL